MTDLEERLLKALEDATVQLCAQKFCVAREWKTFKNSRWEGVYEILDAQVTEFQSLIDEVRNA